MDATAAARRGARLLAGCVAGCAAGDGSSQGAGTPVASTTGAAVVVPDDALRAEPLQMMRDDQVERTGEGLPSGTRLPPNQDDVRMVRLGEIIDEVGWPSHCLVGEGGGTAAWLIAQHADLDVGFQERALGLMRLEARAGEADVTEVAYLADRAAAKRDRPRRYGTQVRCSGGEPRPATPLLRPGRVETRRAAAGTEPLADYYAELAMMCANEAADGEQTGPSRGRGPSGTSATMASWTSRPAT